VRDGVSSAKIYTTYRGTILYVDDWTIYRLMERSGPAGLLLQMHAENDDMLEARKRELVTQGNTSLAYHGVSRPPIAESEAVARGLFLSRVTGSPIYFVHLSNPLSIDLVTEARVKGITAIAETCPHFLVLDERAYAGPDAARYLMTPPLRSPEFQAALWERLGRGQVHAVGSDHCGYSLEQRGAARDFREVRPGIPGVETSLPLLYTYGVCRRRITFPQLVALAAARPARIFGLWPRKGSLEPGADADLVLFDPRAKGKLTAAELHGAAGFSPYEGLDLEGRVRMTVLRGRVVYDRGRVTGDPAWGRYQRRARFDAERSDV
jgi:dihydropyrimidinase